MDRNEMNRHENGVWAKTKEAVAHFRSLLLCSKCSKLMADPVCLGTCDHMLCRVCAGPHAGDGCVVCHSPAWVKDIQINRQLSNITELFCNLESLLSPPEASVPGSPRSHAASESADNAVSGNKKNFKIWFSPRSRKVRCRVEKPEAVSLSSADPDETLPKPREASSKSQDLSVFNFNSSSQDSCSSASPKEEGSHDKKKNKNKKKKPTKSSATRQPAGRRQIPATRNQSRQHQRRLRLEAANQQWGFSGEEEATEPAGRKSSRRVSFRSPGLPVQEPPQRFPARSSGVVSPTDDKRSAAVAANLPASMEEASSPRRTSRGGRMQEAATGQQSTPKRPRPSPGRGRRSLVEGITPLFTPPPSPATPRTPAQASESPALVLQSPRQSSPAFMKRNHKGETPLHLAAIKGDVEAVRSLLEQGADPNLKDNAGWTPLHEACNHGHLSVVETLLSGGALLNTPGYENDSPLHDAVKNGHAAIAKLLLEQGASQSVLNMFGLRPVDYATTQDMLKILEAAREGSHSVKAPLSPPASISKVTGGVRRDQRVTLLGTRLSQAQLRQLGRAARLPGGRLADGFSAAVTHVIGPDADMPSTLSTLQGILNGCWVLKFSWVSVCLQTGGWTDESSYEAGEGAQRGRVNRHSLLPRLFDGCFFYLLGSFQKPPKSDLLQLLKEGGGQILTRQPKPDSDVTQTLNAAAYHARPGSDQALCTQYIIYDPQGSYRPPRLRLGKVWSAPSSWLLDCITSFQLLPVPEMVPSA